jgi:hypothetical protein
MLELKRIALLPYATFGVLLWDGIPFAVTLERPWLDNLPKVSCIPAGKYSCCRFSSPKHPNTFEVENVKNRSAILFHTGNTEADSEGCIVIGEQYAKRNDKTGIAVSRAGFQEFLELTKGIDIFSLEIKEV